ncbi:MAG: glutaminase [Hyphomicrobium sp.]|nr:glutaminase [Hyphomicrobium sp.]
MGSIWRERAPVRRHCCLQNCQTKARTTCSQRRSRTYSFPSPGRTGLSFGTFTVSASLHNRKPSFRSASTRTFCNCCCLDRDSELTLGVYFHQCAIAMTCRQLAKAGLFLANGGRMRSGHSVIPRERARRICALMLTCGHYDASGDFAFRVGLPAKSGVGGGILAVAPGHASIAVWSPGLDRHGNSQLGTRALQAIAERAGWSIFD